MSTRTTRGHSCVLCQQRKVKCDGKRPCSTCLRSGDECNSGVRNKPPRARQRLNRTGARVDDLLLRLKQCEDALQAHEITVDDEPAPAPVTSSQNTQGQMIVKGGDSRYVDNPLWKGLVDELKSVDEDQDDDEVSERNEDDADLNDASLINSERLLLGRHSAPVADAHPTPPQIFQLWQTFLNNVNPLVKLLHAPEVQQMILEAVTDLKQVPREHVALMFAIYLAAITSMDEQACARLFNEPKSTVLTNFTNAAQQALVTAEFLKSSNLVVLQALTLYLLATRRRYDPQSLWLLTGLAIRTGQAMGLHREDSLKAFVPFEQEIRRRLWWQIVILDSRAAQLSGIAVDAHFHLFWDTKRPLNVIDSDLCVTMRELPVPSDGPTEMLFCSIRFEIGECMRQLKSMEKHTGPSRMAEQDGAIDALQERLEKGLLKNCDPAVPFHLMAMYLGLSSVSLMRLSAHLQYRTGSGTSPSLSPAEKEHLFSLGLQVIGYDNLVYGNRALDRYRWHVEMNFPFEAFILVLTELLTRVDGEVVDRAWKQVHQVYNDHPELLTHAKTNVLFFALGSLTFRAWEKRLVVVRAQQPPSTVFVEPSCILTLRSQRTMKCSSPSMPRSHPAGLHSGDGSMDTPRFEAGPPGVILSTTTNELTAMTPASDDKATMSMDMVQVDWKYWQDLLEGRVEPSLDFTALFP